MKRPPVKRQGKVEMRPASNGEIFVMLPDGTIEVAIDSTMAYKKAQAWFKKDMDRDSVNVGTIDWLDGLKPPFGT